MAIVRTSRELLETYGYVRTWNSSGTMIWAGLYDGITCECIVGGGDVYIQYDTTEEKAINKLYIVLYNDMFNNT